MRTSPMTISNSPMDMDGAEKVNSGILAPKFRAEERRKRAAVTRVTVRIVRRVLAPCTSLEPVMGRPN